MEQRELFLASAPALASGFLAQRTPRGPKRVYAALVMGAALAAAALFMLRPPPSPPYVRQKGSVELGFYLKRGERVERGRSTQRVQPGDLVRFVYSSSHPRYLSVLGLDAAHHATVYFPDAPLAARVTAGTDVPLPSSVMLDQTLGPERVIALFCDAPVPLAPLRSALEQSGAMPSMPDGCDTHTLLMQKEARTP